MGQGQRGSQRGTRGGSQRGSQREARRETRRETCRETGRETRRETVREARREAGREVIREAVGDRRRLEIGRRSAHPLPKPVRTHELIVRQVGQVLIAIRLCAKLSLIRSLELN